MTYLVTRDSKGKIRCAEIEYLWEDEGYTIKRTTYQLNGKRTQQPDIRVTCGKAKRTVTEQVQLQTNSKIKEYLDKGYKQIDSDPESYTQEQLNEIVGEIATGQSGVVKPMLAKQADQVTNKKVFDKEYFASRKINGVRCLIYMENGELKTSSRGSINYNLAINHILDNPTLINIFNEHPGLIMDGEIYKHGWTLNVISGVCRKRETLTDGIDLEFYWYDIVDLTKPFLERWEIMQEIATNNNISFSPYKEWDTDELKVQLVPQDSISGFTNMKSLHDQFVSEGWEGLVIRLKTATYGPNKRTNDMIKIKQYIDKEYRIIGIADGLRDEDMCFVMETENGQQFKAKPMGNREQKQWYRNNIDSLIGKMGTLKYFEMSGKEGSEIPQQPIFICVREDLD